MFRYSRPLVFDLPTDNVHSTSHSEDNERRLKAGACFNLSSAKLQIKSYASQMFQ